MKPQSENAGTLADIEAEISTTRDIEGWSSEIPQAHYKAVLDVCW